MERGKKQENVQSKKQNKQELNSSIRMEHAPLQNIHMNNKFIMNQLNQASSKIHKYFHSDEQQEFAITDPQILEEEQKQEPTSKQPEEYVNFIKRATVINLQSKSKQVTSEKIKNLIKNYYKIPQPLSRIQFLQNALVPIIKEQVGNLFADENLIEEQRNKLKEIMIQNDKDKEALNVKDQISHHPKTINSQHISSEVKVPTLGNDNSKTLIQDNVKPKRQFPTHLYHDIKKEKRYPSTKQTLQNVKMLCSIDKLDKSHPIEKRSLSQEILMNDGIKSVQRFIRQRKTSECPYIPMSLKERKQLERNSSDSSMDSSNSNSDEESEKQPEKAEDIKLRDLNPKYIKNDKNAHYYIKKKYCGSFNNRLLVPLNLKSNSGVLQQSKINDPKSSFNSSFFYPTDTQSYSRNSSPTSNLINGTFAKNTRKPSMIDSDKTMGANSTFYDSIKMTSEEAKFKIAEPVKCKGLPNKISNKSSLSFQMIYKNYYPKDSNSSQNSSTMQKYFPKINSKS